MNASDRLARHGMTRESLSSRPSWCYLADATTNDSGDSCTLRFLFPAILSDNDVDLALRDSGFEPDGYQCACASTGGDCCGKPFAAAAHITRSRSYLIVRQTVHIDC